MTANPLDSRRQAQEATEPYFAGFTTLDQMMDECDRRNAAQWVKDMGRWYFVVPASPGVLAHITHVEGSRAAEMHARFQGDTLAWDPEPGEMEWIKKATAEYLRRYPPRITDRPEDTRSHFSRTMAHWSAAKPWRQSAQEAAA